MSAAVRAFGSNQLMWLVEGVPPAFTHGQPPAEGGGGADPQVPRGVRRRSGQVSRL